MKKLDLKNKITSATTSLLAMAGEMCWNNISSNCVYILSEIDHSIKGNRFEFLRVRKSVNDKKIPKKIDEVVSELEKMFDNLYDVNLYVYQSLKEKTIIEIQYFSKTSHREDYYPQIKYNDPMLHCKVAIPPYKSKGSVSGKTKKFDVNWELGGFRYEWNMFVWRLKYRLWKINFYRRRKRKVGLSNLK